VSQRRRRSAAAISDANVSDEKIMGGDIEAGPRSVNVFAHRSLGAPREIQGQILQNFCRASVA
jgi:hypothetical protein